MNRLVIGIAAALPLLAGVSGAAAQKLEPGKWTGTVTGAPSPGGCAQA